LDLAAVEKELLTKALQKFEGNQSRAAAYLNISRKTFLHRLAKFGILKRAASTVEDDNGMLEEATPLPE
jgi:DNA-binding NtrC family response regulator